MITPLALPLFLNINVKTKAEAVKPHISGLRQGDIQFRARIARRQQFFYTR